MNKSKEEYLGYAHEAGWYEPKELVVQYSLLQDLLTTHSQPDKSKEKLIAEFKEELRRGAGGKFYKANPDGTLVVRAEGVEWFSNALDTHSQNREVEIRKEERDRLRELETRIFYLRRELAITSSLRANTT